MISEWFLLALNGLSIAALTAERPTSISFFGLDSAMPHHAIYLPHPRLALLCLTMICFVTHFALLCLCFTFSCLQYDELNCPSFRPPHSWRVQQTCNIRYGVSLWKKTFVVDLFYKFKVIKWTWEPVGSRVCGHNRGKRIACTHALKSAQCSIWQLFLRASAGRMGTQLWS